MYCVCVSEHTKRQLRHRERSITALGLYSVFPVVIPSKENSTFTCHFSFPKWARKKHPARRATMATFSLRALWLSQWRAEKSRSAGMCVPVYDYTWWKEDVLFKRVVRSGSGNASDVALETMRVFKFTTQQAARVVEQPLEQAQAYKQAQGVFHVCNNVIFS